MNLSKNQIKLINSLKLKKKRAASPYFIAEGEKLVLDLLTTMTPELIVINHDVVDKYPEISAYNCVIAKEEEIKKITSLNSAPKMLALFNKKEETTLEAINFSEELILCLDSIQDPGNLGTIIRIADWFGVKNIICSNDTVDLYNNKTIQATMGAIVRVNLIYTDLEIFLKRVVKDGIPVYGTFLDGKDIYSTTLSSNGIIIMGNEGNGISKEVSKLVSSKLLIPNFSHDKETSESLNVAIATGIICSEFRRRE